MTDLSQTQKLLEIMAKLRNPEGGCPWDLEQDFSTIAPYTIEEAYEVADAIARGDMGELKEELGDLLLQVVFHSQMAQEQGDFTFEDVAKAINDKMVARHPHVSGDGDVRDAEAQTKAWEEQKAAEREAKGQGESVLDGVALALPALMRAEKLQKRAARIGFDWPNVRDVIAKVQEETLELQEALAADELDQAHIEEEIGDLLFVVANVARHVGRCPEDILRDANAKFERRFRYVEESLKKMGVPQSSATLAQMEKLWNDAKRLEKSENNAA